MILVDTHTTTWLAEAPEQLSKVAQDEIVAERQIDGLAISDKTLWELAMAISKGRLIVKTSVRDFLQAVELNFRVFPITSAIAERSEMFRIASRRIRVTVLLARRRLCMVCVS